MAETTQITVQMLTSDDCVTLMVRGEHTKEAVIAAAVEQGEIEASDIEKYRAGHHAVNWYHTTPREGYKTWYNVSSEGTRGSFKATVVYIPW